jgi:hypothetical protein
MANLNPNLNLESLLKKLHEVLTFLLPPETQVFDLPNYEYTENHNRMIGSSQSDKNVYHES